MLQPRLNYTFTLKDRLSAICALFSRKNVERSNVATILESDNVYFFDNARSGLQLVLSMLPKESMVGVQPFTCPTVLEAIENAHCKVVFVDINNQLVIDKQTLHTQIEQIDALILTHTFGYPAEVVEIAAMMKGKMLIEDCAHAFMTRNENGWVGKVGDFSIFSHGFAKFPSAIRGGYVLQNNNAYSEAFKALYKTLQPPTLSASVINLIKAHILSLSNNIFIYNLLTKRVKENRKKSFSYIKAVNPELNIQMGFVTCRAVFENQLEGIEQKLQVQQNNGLRVLEALKKNSSFVVCQDTEGLNCFMTPVMVKNPNHFIEYMQRNGIEVGRHFVQSKKVIPHFDYQKGSCTNYERIVENIVTLSVHYNYPTNKITAIVTLITDYKLI